MTTRNRKLSDDEITRALATLPDWTLDGGKLFRAFKFDSFVAAILFMNSAALAAEEMNHHPEWSNVYSRVRVHLETHDVSGLSVLDFELAARMDVIADVVASKGHRAEPR